MHIMHPVSCRKEGTVWLHGLCIKYMTVHFCLYFVLVVNQFGFIYFRGMQQSLYICSTSSPLSAPLLIGPGLVRVSSDKDLKSSDLFVFLTECG